MARAAKTAEAPRSESTALVNWEAEMEAQAAVAAGMEANSGGGQFFSLRGGMLTFNDRQMPNNELPVIIAAHVLENVFYEGEYDPDRTAPPTCFAHGDDEATMAPHASVVAAGQAQHEKCAGCPMNEWGTAEKGKGKACKNVRRLALLPAGHFENNRYVPEELDAVEKAQFGYLKIPVMSVKGFASFVKAIAGTLKRPPHGIITKMKVVPDPKSQIRVIFEPIDKVPPAWISTVMKRHDEAKSLIEFPYPLTYEADDAAPAAKGRGGKTAAPVNRRPEVKKRKY